MFWYFPMHSHSMWLLCVCMSSWWLTWHCPGWSVVCLAFASSQQQPASWLRLIWVGMWKDLYCFALRIDMVLPDWRGFIGLGLDCSRNSWFRLIWNSHDSRTSWKGHVLSLDWLISLVLHWWLIDWESRVVSITFAWLLCARRESPLDGQMRFSRSSPHWDGSSWRCMHVWCDRTRMDCQSTSHIVTIVSIVYISRLHSEKCRAYASVTAAFDGTACIESFFLLV